MRKIALILIAVIAVGMLTPLFANAIGPKGGLVPCGRDADPSTATSYEDPTPSSTPNMNEGIPCQLCHLFLMFGRIVEFVLTWVVPPIAVLMIIFGGLMFLFAGASPEQLTRAKGILTTVAIGLVLIYGAWIITNGFLGMMGVKPRTGLDTWYKFDLKNCPKTESDLNTSFGPPSKLCKSGDPECKGTRKPKETWTSGGTCNWCDKNCNYGSDSSASCGSPVCEIGKWKCPSGGPCSSVNSCSDYRWSSQCTNDTCNVTSSGQCQISNCDSDNDGNLGCSESNINSCSDYRWPNPCLHDWCNVGGGSCNFDQSNKSCSS